ncbi:MAG: helix-turn-helix domain-containing protein [Eggerthellaceae bacterium]|jgi:excisionase family DNA binding protein
MKTQTTQGGASARIMTLQEAAEYLHTSYSTVYRLVTSGELDAFRLRNSWRTSSLACEAYVRHQFAEQAISCRPVAAE